MRLVHHFRRRLPASERVQPSAWGEVVAGEHRARLAAIRGQGVPVLSWSDGATVAATLRRLRRRR
ncbi:POSSIBLE CONSERVED SECRETED PROTEIN [Alloactinosynnema sp. L-07]|nr:POSSIBLE CONSERVED SECRETED PROTEIN [Alloactinosynnema sp. L-07]